MVNCKVDAVWSPFYYLVVMVDPGLFGDFHKGNCTCNQMQSLYSTDCDNLPILYLVKPVFVPNVGICQSRQIVNNFPVRSRKTKIFTWKYIRMNPNVKFFARWTLVIPLISKKLNLGDFQKTGIPMDMRPAFFSRVLEKWVGMLILWSRNQDWWFLFFA